MLHLVKTSNRNAYFRSLFSQIWIHSLSPSPPPLLLTTRTL